MFRRSLSVAKLGCVLLLAPLGSSAANRGPSTPEERKQALKYIGDFQADPLNPNLQPEIQWVVKWTQQIPDVRLDLCSSFYKLREPEKKDGQTLFTAMVFAQTVFVLQNPDKQNDHLAQYQAGVEGVLRIYETLRKGNPRDRQPFLDDLIQRREAGSLAQFVKERAAASCGK
jgi:hypothetical protein